MTKTTQFCYGPVLEGSTPIQYKNAGLEGIYLVNGYTIDEIDGESFLTIKDWEGLHKAIGKHIVTHRKALAPEEIKFLRKCMDKTQEQFAQMLGKTSQSVARWEKGQIEIPTSVEKLLRTIFLVFVMSDEELSELRDFLDSKMEELDVLDEIGTPKAQFQLFENWEEKAIAA